MLSIDPCFYFGNLNKVVLSGPWPVEDDTAFVPTPVDTTTVSKIIIHYNVYWQTFGVQHVCRKYLCCFTSLVLTVQCFGQEINV